MITEAELRTLLRGADTGLGSEEFGKLRHRIGDWPLTGSQWRVSADLPATRTGTGYLVAVDEPPPGFASFAAARMLLARLVPIARREAPELLSEISPEFAWLLADLPGDDGPGPSENGSGGDQLTARGMSQRVAETIVFAVTRRISRESHHSAIQIDGLADLVLRMRSRCPCLRQGLIMRISRLDRWDRPSLRFLHRLTLLASPDDHITIVASLGQLPAAVEPPRDLQDWVTRARWRFLERLADGNGFRLPPTVGQAAAGQAAAGQERPGWALPEVDGSTRDLLLEIGAALGYQNYERAYLLAERMLGQAADPEDEAQAHRLVAVAHAQMGEVPAAEAELQIALKLSADPPYRAHLEYLSGLLATKRHYDMDEATKRYQRGEHILEELGQDTPTARIERAWLLNGQALVLALKARGLPPGEERDALLRHSAKLEMDAYALVKGADGPAAAYLRHNLLANITFLLEISKRFDQAVEFWKRAFERFLAADSRTFTVAFDGRLGLLLCKAGSTQEGIEALERARVSCHAVRDPFYEERMCLALGYAAFQAGQYDRALAAFADGAGLAVRLRDRQAHAEHVAGVLWSLAELDDRAGFLSVIEETRAADHLAGPLAAVAEAVSATESLPDALRLADVSLRMPSPKMPSYIPAVDLEGTPARDLNRYLVDDRSPATARA